MDLLGCEWFDWIVNCDPYLGGLLNPTADNTIITADSILFTADQI